MFKFAIQAQTSVYVERLSKMIISRKDVAMCNKAGSRPKMRSGEWGWGCLTCCCKKERSEGERSPTEEIKKDKEIVLREDKMRIL